MALVIDLNEIDRGHPNWLRVVAERKAAERAAESKRQSLARWRRARKKRKQPESANPETKTFDESQHPRVPAGQPGGGQFKAKAKEKWRSPSIK